MKKKFHISLEVNDIRKSILDYSNRLGQQPDLAIKDQYALWRTDSLNFSIRKGNEAGRLRHLGFEDSEATLFSSETDSNGILWEHFNAEQQAEEIENIWGK